MEKEFVEIAGIKWATMNVGAEKETDTGLYFQWGDTQGYAADEIGTGEDEKLFYWTDYKYGKCVTKYNSVDGKTVLEASDDAVTAAWGDDWRMPTKEEYAELRKAVNAALAYDYKGSGVAGLVCTDKTDSSKVLFFPACGYCYNGCVYNVGDYGYYWSSSFNNKIVQFAYYLYFYNVHVNWNNSCSRLFGFPVRGVMK